MEVLKFGGSLLDGSEGARRAAQLVSEIAEPPVLVVVSAFREATNRLEQIAQLALDSPNEARQHAAKFWRDHHSIAREVLTGKHLEAYLARVGPLEERLSEVVEGIEIVGELSPRTLDLVVSFGERASSAIMTELCGATYVGACDIVVTDNAHRYARPDIEKIGRNVADKLLPAFDRADVVVTEGYIACSEAGEITTMGRESSDYSATLLAEAAAADCVTLYTGVPGIMTADPELEPDARVIPRISWAQARLIAELGAKVLHPRTVTPVERAGISLQVRSPDSEGTEIAGEEDLPVRAAITHREASLIRVRTERPSDSVDAFLAALSRISPILWYSRFRREVTVVTATSIRPHSVPVDQFSSAELLELTDCGLLSAMGGSSSLRLAMLALASDGVGVLGTSRGGENEPLIVAMAREEIPDALHLLHRHHVLSDS